MIKCNLFIIILKRFIFTRCSIVSLGTSTARLLDMDSTVSIGVLYIKPMITYIREPKYLE